MCYTILKKLHVVEHLAYFQFYNIDKICHELIVTKHSEGLMRVHYAIVSTSAYVWNVYNKK
jgi:hypothetical protein